MSREPVTDYAVVCKDIKDRTKGIFVMGVASETISPTWAAKSHILHGSFRPTYRTCHWPIHQVLARNPNLEEAQRIAAEMARLRGMNDRKISRLQEEIDQLRSQADLELNRYLGKWMR